MNARQMTVALMLLFALVGIVDASYDSYAIYADRLLWCPPPIDGCNTVASSPYARIFGIPLGYLGTTYYLSMFVLAAFLGVNPFSRGLLLAVLLYAALGVASSICFLFIQITYIHAFCIYCLISAVMAVSLLVVAVWHLRMTRPSIL